MNTNPLQCDNVAAVIVGNGAIGTALAEALLQRKQVRRLVMLQRNNVASITDPRVIMVRFDAQKPESVVNAAKDIGQHLQRVHLMINTVGVLHDGQLQPEKSLRNLDHGNLLRSLTVNALLLPVLAQAFGSLLRHDEPAIFASLSARVGSIEDNRLGGWYSYRASKAAHNMLLRTLSHEWRLSQPNTALIALHPGTVHSPLSAPFISSSYRNAVHTPCECAEHLLQVLSGVTSESSGQFLDWQGKTIPW